MLWLGRQPSLGEGVSPLSSGLNYGNVVYVTITELLIISLSNTHNLINEYLCYSICGITEVWVLNFLLILFSTRDLDSNIKPYSDNFVPDNISVKITKPFFKTDK